MGDESMNLIQIAGVGKKLSSIFHLKKKETKFLYSIKGKKYMTSRHEMHIRIVNELMKVAVSVEKEKKPLAILIGGGTASGKTTLRKIVIESELSKRGIYAVTVDPDIVKEYIPEFNAYKKTDPSHAAYLVHKESCDISALLLDHLIKNWMHLIYEGTMAKTPKYVKLIKKLKKAGYEVHAYVVDVPIEVAKQRSDDRAKLTRRKVPHHVIENTHKLVPITIERIKNQLDSYQIYDTQHDLTLIASNNYVEPELYSNFLKKSGINPKTRL